MLIILFLRGLCAIIYIDLLKTLGIEIRNINNFKEVHMSFRLPAISSDTGLSRYLIEISSIPSLTREEEETLAIEYLNGGDISHAQKLVASHLKLVAKIAMQYRNYGLSLVDLISEGNLGLMHAVKKFDPSLGFRLSTYSIWWIKAAIQEYVIRSWSLVKIGTTAAQKKLFFSLNKMKNKISAVHERKIESKDYDQIADELNVKKEDVAEMDHRLSNRDASLNAPINRFDQESGNDLVDHISSPHQSHDITIVDEEDMKIKRSILSEGIKTLSDRDRDILIERKLSNPHKTLEELSVKYNISKERVRQIEVKAFNSLKNYVLSKTSFMNQTFC